MSQKFDVDGEVLAEEDVEGGAAPPTRALEPHRESLLPVLSGEVRTAAIAAAARRRLP